MAVLLAWLSWREAAPEERDWVAMRERAEARVRFGGRELSGAGWRVFAAPSQRGEADPVSESDGRVRLLDWAPWSPEMAATRARLAELRDGPALAAIDLEFNADRSLRRVVAARDVLGRRLLVHAQIRGGLLLASGEDILLGHPDVSRELDRGFIAAYLAGRAPEHQATAYGAIRTLIAGELRQVDASGTHSERRALQPDWRWREMSDDAIVGETHRLLIEATSRCVYGAERVGLSLSAGIDSLSVAAALAALPAQTPKILAVTYGFDEWPDIDERAMAREAAAALGIEWRGFAADQLHPLAPQLARPVCPDSPISSLFREMKETAYEHFEQSGASLWLSGSFGDHLSASPADRLADALRSRRIGPFSAELFGILAAGPKALSDPALRRLVRVLLPQRMRGQGFPFIDPGDQLRQELNARWHDELLQHRRFPRPHQALTCLNGYAMFSASGESWYAARHAMATADPYRDPDLVRWMLSIPADLQATRNQPKALWRRWLRRRLPTMLVERPKSSNLAPFVVASLKLATMRLRRYHQRGLAVGSDVLGHQLTEMQQKSRDDNPTPRSVLARYRLTYLGLWLDSRSG